MDAVLEGAPVPLPALPGWPGTRETYRRYDRDRVAFLRESQERFGDAYRFGDDTLVTHDPELIRSVQIRSNQEFISEEAPIGTAVEDQALLAQIARWMTGRTLVGQSMRRVDLAARAPEFEAELVRAVAPARSAAPPDTLPLMTAYVSRSTARYCLGDAADGYHPTAAETARRSVQLMSASWQLPGWLPIGPGRAWKRSEERSRRVMAGIIRSRRDHPAGGDTLVDLLVAAGLDDRTIDATLRPTIGAAFGVPGTALTWALVRLLDRPDWQARIAEEFRQAGPATADITHAMPWTTGYARETLRLHVPTWLMARQAITDTTLGPARLPRGTRVMFSPLLVHTDPRWWAEPLRFDPDRWQDGAPSSKAYFPFGAGPRMCLGAILGTTHLVWALGYLSTHYRLQPVEVDARPIADALYRPTTCRIEFRLAEG